MKILSWNVNGLRSCAKKGFEEWLQTSKAGIVGLQEVRAQQDQLPPSLIQSKRWKRHFVAAKRPGYSGVGFFGRIEPEEVETLLGESRFDDEGRVQILRFGRLQVANVYFPNGNGKDRDNSRVPFKLAFYQQLLDKLQAYRRAGQRVLVMGDFNTAHRPIDLARPQANQKTSGFLPEERAEFDRWLQAGWIDTFRHFHSQPGHYSWWSQRSGARERNVGWRIDYVLASPEAMQFVCKAFLQPQVLGSDHCPVGVEVDSKICLP